MIAANTPEREDRPWFPCYAGDLIGSSMVFDLGTEGVGAFWLLICHQWTNNGLPNDLTALGRRVLMSDAKFRKLWKAGLGDEFPEASDGRLRNPRLEEIRREQSEHSELQSLRQKLRWAKKRNEVPEDTTLEQFRAIARGAN